LQDAYQQTQKLPEEQKASKPKIQEMEEQMARAAVLLHQEIQDAGPSLRLRLLEKPTTTPERADSPGWERQRQVEGWHCWKSQPGQHNLEHRPVCVVYLTNTPNPTQHRNHRHGDAPLLGRLQAERPQLANSNMLLKTNRPEAACCQPFLLRSLAGCCWMDAAQPLAPTVGRRATKHDAVAESILGKKAKGHSHSEIGVEQA